MLTTLFTHELTKVLVEEDRRITVQPPGASAHGAFAAPVADRLFVQAVPARNTPMSRQAPGGLLPRRPEPGPPADTYLEAGVLSLSSARRLPPLQQPVLRDPHRAGDVTVGEHPSAAYRAPHRPALGTLQG